MRVIIFLLIISYVSADGISGDFRMKRPFSWTPGPFCKCIIFSIFNTNCSHFRIGTNSMGK